MMADGSFSSVQQQVPSNAQQQLSEEIQRLHTVLLQASLPDDLKKDVEQMITRLQRLSTTPNYSEEYDRVSHYLKWISALPWNTRSRDILDLEKARAVLEKHHYGLQDVKDRLLEYISALKLRAQQSGSSVVHAPVVLLVGLVGTGKTSFAYSLAEALGRKIVRIPFGGLSSAKDLRGQSRLHLESEPGYIIRAIKQAGTKNPVVLLDEIDRVSDDARGEIMGVLVELLDPEQNMAFTDHYVDYPFDLSEVLFVATANNTDKIATAVLDRLETITMPSYTDEEKIEIARRHLFPKALEEVGLPAGSITITDSVWPMVVRPLGFDAGIRTLQRTIKGIVRKAARQIVEATAQGPVQQAQQPQQTQQQAGAFSQMQHLPQQMGAPSSMQSQQVPQAMASGMQAQQLRVIQLTEANIKEYLPSY